VAGADQASRAPPTERGPAGRREAVARIVSACILAPVAIAAAYLGGAPFVLFWGVAAVGIWWEWARLSAGSSAQMVLILGTAALVAATIVPLVGPSWGALACLATGLCVVAIAAPSNGRLSVAGGVLYAGAALVAPTALRRDAELGFTAIIFLFGIVWATDILAYFVGRAAGGPKLAPHLSPNKTWSGAIAGACGAMLAAIAVALTADLGHAAKIALIGFALSCVSQAGDLFESAFKRWYGAKDTGRIIPGHGGLMDRLDGFIAAAVAAAILGALRGGADAPARGLMVW